MCEAGGPRGGGVGGANELLRLIEVQRARERGPLPDRHAAAYPASPEKQAPSSAPVLWETPALSPASLGAGSRPK